MEQIKQIVADAKANNALRVPVYVETLAEAVREHDDALGMLTAFRHAANSLAVEAGVIGSRVPHDEAAKSVLQDVYFPQLIAEAELRYKSLSVRYEKLRAAVCPLIDGAPQLVEILTDYGHDEGAETLNREISEILEVIHNG